MSASNKLKKAVEKVNDNFANINISLLDAEQAAANLQEVWNNIYSKIDTSAKELANIKEGTKLSTFKIQFEKVINPWRKVEDLTIQLAQLFNKALEEYKKLETSISKPLI
ncbi:hypothetical protein I8748_27615 [Nostoc sp. CENA67]|uniref:Uncharacterized protein n=1 Tax=Amazonocrinis nigriterrae CENA67 TaxID=2794033 RepID=A0A8J7HX30_9NOST|nr:hypothetical protein [Amazonocrinis nigriterrae]MBH8565890.1 hypothetical protein [Amazonocrinis nigriterrae CENA67]